MSKHIFKNVGECEEKFRLLNKDYTNKTQELAAFKRQDIINSNSLENLKRVVLQRMEKILDEEIKRLVEEDKNPDVHFV